MKVFKKILKNIVLIILIIILIYVMYSKYVKKDELISLFGNSILVVVTGSMKPVIEPEELIIISKEKEYKTNDIVTYKDEDGDYITHRIEEIYGNTFITRGDSNNMRDNPCNIESIKGKVIFHSKILGFFILYLLKPIIFIYLIIIFLIELFKILKIPQISKNKISKKI